MGLLLTMYMAESCFGNLEITNGQSTCEEREGVKNSGRELMKVKVLQILLQIRHVVIARDQTIHAFFFFPSLSPSKQPAEILPEPCA